MYLALEDGAKNKAAFDSLLGERVEIERNFRSPLEWERLEDRRASSIATYRSGSTEADSERLKQLRNWGIHQLLNLEDVFGPRLRRHLTAV